MRVIRIEDLELHRSVDTARGGLEFYEILEGTPGDPANFRLLLSATLPGYYAPRHKHNFEQVRYKIDTVPTRYDDLGNADAGSVGYFPEGTPYGPASSEERTQGLILQYGGPSGHGYMSLSEYKEHFNALKKRGTFQKGIFTWHDEAGGKHNQDGYEAVWESWSGRKLEYPKQRYRSAILMEPENFPWTAAKGRAGVRHRQLGVFGDPGTKLEMISLAPGVTLPLEDRSIYFVSHGAGQVPSPWSRHSTFFLKPGERGSIVAGEATELLHIGMPNLDGVGQRVHASAA
jgi:hypothetical protein